jgi:phospholipid/cholesterol/gamma-HCH transport system substrate-binding protein
VIVAAAAVVAAIVIVAVLFFAGAGSYTVHAVFLNGGQLVSGDQVQVGGRPVGSIEKIALTQDGRARVDMKLDEFSPLHEGTSATIRATSLSGIASRYVSLDLGPDSAPKIPDGGAILAERTTTPVDLDQLFDALDPTTLAGLQKVVKGSATQYAGKAAQANLSLKYFNPTLSTGSRLVREIITDQVTFQRFVTDTSRTVSAIAARRDDLASLVGNADQTAAAIGDENVALGQALGLLPTSLRKANTTFVNLRATLDDLDTLVSASKPATKNLAKFFSQLRPLVADSKPTIRDLRNLIRTPGPNNDLIELAGKTPRLQSLTSQVFPRSITALKKAQPVIEYARPYTPDLVGWFQAYGEGGNTYDANGHYARIQPLFNAFSFTEAPGGPVLTFTGATNRLQGFQTRQIQRCPGGAMQPTPDGTAPYKETPDFSCDPSTSPPP